MNTNTFTLINAEAFQSIPEKRNGVPPHGNDSAIAEINRLHAEAQRLERDSRNALDSALAAAWQAGKLLISEKASIRRHAGRGAWLPWLQTCFKGGVRTAQRYMQIARRIETPAELRGLSLRQACLRLGIAISPKSSGTAVTVPKLPPHIVFAVRLTRYLHAQSRISPGAAFQEPSPELTALYEQLRTLFEGSSVKDRTSCCLQKHI